MTEKHQRVKNENYRKFLDGGFIEIIEIDMIHKIIEKMQKDDRVKYKEEATTLLATLYYTGARPCEVLSLKPKLLTRDNNYINIYMPTRKRGRARIIQLLIKKPYVKEIYEYSRKLYADMFMFWNYRSRSTKFVTNKKTNEVRHYDDITNKLYYHIKMWFEGVIDITPYYMRHSRFSKLSMTGEYTERDIMQMKGGKSLSSVEPYLHLNKQRSKKLAKFND